MDNVNHPAHYTSGKVETIDLITFIVNSMPKLTNPMVMGFLIGNAVKYLSRAGLKTENEVEDCKKARWYLLRAQTVGSNLSRHLLAKEIDWFNMATEHMADWKCNVLYFLATNQFQMALNALNIHISKIDETTKS